MYVVVVVVLINGDMKNTFLAWSVLLIRPHVSGDELNYKQLIPTIKTRTKFEEKKLYTHSIKTPQYSVSRSVRLNVCIVATVSIQL